MRSGMKHAYQIQKSLTVKLQLGGYNIINLDD